MNDPNFKGDSYISFDPDASYDNMEVPKVPISAKPDVVPGLILEGLPEYISSDEEEELNDMEVAAEKGKKNKVKSF